MSRFGMFQTWAKVVVETFDTYTLCQLGQYQNMQYLFTFVPDLWKPIFSHWWWRQPRAACNQAFAWSFSAANGSPEKKRRPVCFVQRPLFRLQMEFGNACLPKCSGGPMGSNGCIWWFRVTWWIPWRKKLKGSCFFRVDSQEKMLLQLELATAVSLLAFFAIWAPGLGLQLCPNSCRQFLVGPTHVVYCFFQTCYIRSLIMRMSSIFSMTQVCSGFNETKPLHNHQPDLGWSHMAIFNSCLSSFTKGTSKNTGRPNGGGVYPRSWTNWPIWKPLETRQTTPSSRRHWRLDDWMTGVEKCPKRKLPVINWGRFFTMT